MAISVDWPTQVITVNQSDPEVTFISGTTYELDTDAFRLALKALEDDEEGMPSLRITKHNTVVTIDGIQYVRSWEIINGYTVQCLPNTSWRLRMDGLSNNNFHSEGILILNNVQVIPANSAGGVAGVTDEQAGDISLTRKLLDNRRELADGTTGNLKVYDDDDVAVLRTYDVTDEDDNAVALSPGDPAKQSKGA